jgi:hypothetical protein
MVTRIDAGIVGKNDAINAGLSIYKCRSLQLLALSRPSASGVCLLRARYGHYEKNNE